MSIEGEFGMSATCDILGHVMLTINIKELDDPEVWSSKISLGLDSGKTENIEKYMKLSNGVRPKGDSYITTKEISVGIEGVLSTSFNRYL
ncbi:MAG: hypothetical protein AB2809_13670 [Candidatus Thiodiazotropha sp.]